MVCDSPFRLPRCDAVPETRQDSGEGKFLSRFRRAIKINPELEPVMLEPCSRCGLKAFPSSAALGRNSRSGCFHEESLPHYVGRVLMHLQAPCRTCWDSHGATRSSRDYSSLPFQSTSPHYRILQNFTMENPRKEEGSITLSFFSRVPRKFLVKGEILSRMFPRMQRLHLQGDVLSQMERLLAALGNRFKANGILVTPQVAQSPQLLTPTEINKDKN